MTDVSVTCSDLSECSDLKSLFGVEGGVAAGGRPAAVPRPEKPHLQALVRGQRSRLLKPSHNSEAQTENRE